MRRLSALYSQEMITADIIDNELSSNSNHAPETPPSGSAKLNEWMEAYLSDYFGSFGDQLAASRPLRPDFARCRGSAHYRSARRHPRELNQGGGTSRT